MPDLRWYDSFIASFPCNISLDGVLGGFGHLTPVDVRDSNAFLRELRSDFPGICFDSAVDCGAGVGRVTKNLLLQNCRTVTLVEQSPRLLAAARDYLGPIDEEKSVIYVQQGLQVSISIISPVLSKLFLLFWFISGVLSGREFVRFNLDSGSLSSTIIFLSFKIKFYSG